MSDLIGGRVLDLSSVGKHDTARPVDALGERCAYVHAGEVRTMQKPLYHGVSHLVRNGALSH